MPSLAHAMPQKEGKIDWQWATFWSMFFPFSIQSTAPLDFDNTPTPKKEKISKRNIGS